MAKDTKSWVSEQPKPESDREKELQSKVRKLEDENHRLSKQLGLVESYVGGAGTPPTWLRPKARKHKHAATAFMQLSDLHLDEVVSPSEMNGLNAYNREIAELRLKRWADKACEMGERHKHEWDGCVVMWSGDMVSGAIHEELRHTNADYLPRTILHWAPLLAAAIKQVAGFYGGAYVPCVVGNHGRLTEKMTAKGRAKNSWDYLLSGLVKAHFKDDPSVQFEISESDYLIFPSYDRYVWQSHGDEAKGGGGWAGIWSPLGTIYKRAVELAAEHDKRIDYVAVGHWHTTVLAHARGLVCNGSIKGYDEYARSKRFKPEKSMQNWWLTSPEHGVVLSGPLLLEDKKREGW